MVGSELLKPWREEVGSFWRSFKAEKGQNAASVRSMEDMVYIYHIFTTLDRDGSYYARLRTFTVRLTFTFYNTDKN